MKFIILMMFLLQVSFAADFYASKELQDKYPGAFATQGSTQHFHQELAALEDRASLVDDIKSNATLHHKLLQFNSLSLDEQVDVLNELFLLECKNLNMTPPELIIDETSIPGWAFFEFDFALGGAGKVYLNKAKLKTAENKAEFIILLLHETRHSAQFQLAQKDPHSPLGVGYVKAFTAQKEMKTKGIKTSFCDFMLLLNEYEAFQFANYVHGALTNFQTPINDMGTLASQYDSQGEIRLDINEVLSNLDLFNEKSKIQYEVMYE